MPDAPYKKAIVIGGGIAGLVNAQVLSDFFEEVIVYEKEAPINYGENRRSTPHTRHGHILWKKGEEILNEIFPNFTQEMIDRGSFQFNAADDFDWYHDGQWKLKYPSSINLISQSRSLLESYIQERTLRNSKIRLVCNTKVTEIMCSEGVVVGMKVDDGIRSSVDSADFYLDTTGSSSAYLTCAQGSIFSKSFDVNLTYLSAVFQIPVHLVNNPTGITYIRPRGPLERNGGGILRIEGNRWLVTLYGYDGAALEQSIDGLLQSARQLPDGLIYDLIKDAVLLSEIDRYKIRSVYCRNLKAADLPARLLVGGDAICRLDPVFGQGVTMICIYADVLRSIVRSASDLHSVQRAYFAAVNRATFVPWQMAKTEDFRYPGIKNERSVLTWLSMRYSDWLFPLIANDAYVCERFLKVINLQSSPIILFSPLIWVKMLKLNVNRKS